MPETQQMPPPGMGHMATEARMVLRDESRSTGFCARG
jgi:hypothetical protein